MVRHMPTQITFRPDAALMAEIERRAADRGLTLNDWLTKAVTYAMAHQGRVVTVRSTTETTYII